MELKRFCDMMEGIAPKALALDFDNVGLLIEPDHTEIKKVLLALDCTSQVAKEAAEWGADLVVTHHPQFFHGVKSIGFSSPTTGAAAILLRNGIGHFAAHTNLDAAIGGVNDTLCDLLGLVNIQPLAPENIGRVGRLPTPLKLKAFSALCGRLLSAQAAFAGEGDKLVSTVAVLGGSGGGDIDFAFAAGADAFLTGEAHHHQILQAREMGLGLVLCGHYETERVVLKSLYNRLQNESRDVQYAITLREKAQLQFS